MSKKNIDFGDKKVQNFINLQKNQNEKFTNDSDNLNSIDYATDIDDYFSN